MKTYTCPDASPVQANSPRHAARLMFERIVQGMEPYKAWSVVEVEWTSGRTGFDSGQSFTAILWNRVDKEREIKTITITEQK